jgi:hypothetical protein
MDANSEATESARRAQDEANQMGMTEEEERAAKEHQAKTGEPVRDRLGNEDGAS